MHFEVEWAQYKAWTSSILAVLQNLKEEGIALKITKVFQWKNSVEAVLQDLRSENDILVEENKKKKETIRSLLYHLEEIKKDNAEIIRAMIQLLLSDSELTEVTAVSLEFDINNIEEDASRLMRPISSESGYFSSREEDTPKPKTVEKKTEALSLPVIKLQKRNNDYKTWISTVENRFSTNSGSNSLFDLKILSNKKIALIEKNKKKDEIIQSLKTQLKQEETDNLDLRKDNNALQEASLWKKIRNQQFHSLLDFSEKIVDKEKVELSSMQNDLENLQKKMVELDQNAKRFTMCLWQTKKLCTLLTPE